MVEEFLCVVPAIILIIVTVYYPLADLVRISFTDWNLLRQDYNYVGWTNWDWFIHNASGNHFFESLWITLKYTFGALSISLIGGMALALIMNRLTKGFNLMRGLIFLPHYVAMSTGAIIFLWILNKNYGIVNCVIQYFGGPQIGWLSTGRLAMFSILLLTGWHGLGYSMMIYLSAMLGIPKVYYDAAALDGANRRQRFLYITLPLLSPTILFLFVTQFVGSMKVYNSIQVMTDGGPFRQTEVLVFLIYRLAFQDYRVDRAAVVSIVFFLMLLVFTVATMRWSENKVHYDA